MKLRAITLAIAIVAMTSGSALAQSGTIGVFYDTAGTVCAADIGVYANTSLYILAKPDVAQPPVGVTGAEFRLKGFTPTMLDGTNAILTATANPLANVTLGNPLSDETQAEGSRGGCNIAFPDCRPADTNGVVLLYTVTVLFLTLENDIVLEIDRHDTPSNPQENNYALVNGCDAPFFTARQVIQGRAYLNHSSPGGCTVVAVEERTWGSIKKMYN